MKKTHIISLAVLVVCTFIALSSFKTTGMHPSSTGAPGELTCANAEVGCHSTASVTNDNSNIVNTLTYSVADSSYVPGQTYTFTLKAQKSGIAKFGFGMVALQNSNTANIGTWIVTETARTHTVSGTGSLASRKYITHSTNGTPAVSAGLGQWTFNWKAPASNVGKITFYYATNCTNNNGQNTGDQLFLSSFQIHPFVSTTSIAEWINESDFHATLNPSSNQLVLDYKLKKECELSVDLFDAQGKMIQKVEPASKSAGEYSDHIDLAQDISTGIYFVHLGINKQTLTKKLMIQ